MLRQGLSVFPAICLERLKDIARNESLMVPRRCHLWTLLLQTIQLLLQAPQV